MGRGSGMGRRRACSDRQEGQEACLVELPFFKVPPVRVVMPGGINPTLELRVWRNNRAGHVRWSAVLLYNDHGGS